MTPPGPLHQAVEQFMIEEIETYLDRARSSKIHSVKDCARRIKWLPGRSMWLQKDVDLNDPSYKPPGEPLTPEKERKSRRLSRTSQRSAPVDYNNAARPYQAAYSGESEESESSTATIVTEQYFPDSSWAWQDREKDTYHQGPVVLEIAASRTIEQLKTETLDRLNKFPFRSVVGIDINNKGRSFEGHGRLEKDATYALSWAVAADKAAPANGGEPQRILDTSMTCRVLDPSCRPCAPTPRIEMLYLEEFIPDNELEYYDKQPGGASIFNYPPFYLNIARLRTAVRNGYAAKKHDEEAARHGPVRVINTRMQSRRRERREARLRRNLAVGERPGHESPVAT